MTDEEMAHATGGLTDAEVNASAPGRLASLNASPTARRAAAGMSPGPREYADESLGIDAPVEKDNPGRIGRAIESIATVRVPGPELSSDQGVTGMNGETGDPLAREIESSLVMNGPAMLLGRLASKGVRYGAEKLLTSKGGRAAETIANAASAPVRQSTSAAERFILTHRMEEAKAAATSMMDQLGSSAESVAASNPQVREVLGLPSKLEAQLAQGHDAVGAARETLRPKGPTAYGVGSGAAALAFGHGKFAPLAIAADLALKNAAPIAGRLAGPARAMVNSAPMTPLDLFMAAQTAMPVAGAVTGRK